jgi:hypothetical protein
MTRCRSGPPPALRLDVGRCKDEQNALARVVGKPVVAGGRINAPKRGRRHAAQGLSTLFNGGCKWMKKVSKTE